MQERSDSVALGAAMLALTAEMGVYPEPKCPPDDNPAEVKSGAYDSHRVKNRKITESDIRAKEKQIAKRRAKKGYR